MCFYLLPFLALSRREVEELPAPPALPAWAQQCRAALGRAWWLHRPWEQPGSRTGLLGCPCSSAQEPGAACQQRCWPRCAASAQLPPLPTPRAALGGSFAAGAAARGAAAAGSGISAHEAQGSCPQRLSLARQQDPVPRVGCADGVAEGRAWPGAGLGVSPDG